MTNTEEERDAFGLLPRHYEEAARHDEERRRQESKEWRKQERIAALSHQRKQISKWQPHKFLESYRKKLRKTQTQFAAYMGVAPRTYNYYESGERAIPHTALQSIAAQIDIDLNFLLTGNPSLGLRDAAVSKNILINQYLDKVETAVNKYISQHGEIYAQNCANLGKPVSREYAKLHMRQFWQELLPHEKRRELATDEYYSQYDINYIQQSSPFKSVEDFVYYWMNELLSDYFSGDPDEEYEDTPQ